MPFNRFKLTSVSIQQNISQCNQLLAQTDFLISAGCVCKSILYSEAVLQYCIYKYIIIMLSNYNHL